MVKTPPLQKFLKNVYVSVLKNLNSNIKIGNIGGNFNYSWNRSSEYLGKRGNQRIAMGGEYKGKNVAFTKGTEWVVVCQCWKGPLKKQGCTRSPTP